MTTTLLCDRCNAIYTTHNSAIPHCYRCHLAHHADWPPRPLTPQEIAAAARHARNHPLEGP